MRRRSILLGLGGVASVASIVRAQSAGRAPLLGLLVTDRVKAVFVPEMARLGYIDGKTVRYESRPTMPAEGLNERAAELVALRVDLIVANGTEAARAAQLATRTIPIVMTGSSDPERTGLVASLARPGGNTTGVSLSSGESSGKRLELLKEIVPPLSRIAVLWNPTDPPAALALKETVAAGGTLGLQVFDFATPTAEAFPTAFQNAAAAGAGALVILSSPMMSTNARLLAALALRYRLPSIYWNRVYAAEGGLLSYGPDVVALVRRAAVFADKILRGAKPGDLPVEQPVKFELVLNASTAKALGITLSPLMLARADEVIE